jgi:hypothetical protein
LETVAVSSLLRSCSHLHLHSRFRESGAGAKNKICLPSLDGFASVVMTSKIFLTHLAPLTRPAPSSSTPSSYVLAPSFVRPLSVLFLTLFLPLPLIFQNPRNPRPTRGLRQKTLWTGRFVGPDTHDNGIDCCTHRLIYRIGITGPSVNLPDQIVALVLALSSYMDPAFAVSTPCVIVASIIYNRTVSSICGTLVGEWKPRRRDDT